MHKLTIFYSFLLYLRVGFVDTKSSDVAAYKNYCRMPSSRFFLIFSSMTIQKVGPY